MTRRRRVLVLGGGCGGLAAAWALSRTTELRRTFDVTVVQPGFRLGGKGATGRDPLRGHRILEHGLHLWLGFYRTAFRMMADVYAAWDRPLVGPLRSLETAFSPLYNCVLGGGDASQALRGATLASSPSFWRVRCPELPGRPWDDAPLWSMGAVAGWVRGLGRVFDPLPEERERSRERVLVGAALVAAIGRGLVADLGPVVPSDDAFRALDEHDLRAWLRRHGATDEVADAPPIRALYDLGFAYPDGVAGPGRGAMAAGAGLRTLLKIFGAYRGAPFWRMNAGMGDTVFAPMYEVLRARGVHFRFFSRVDRLRLDARGRAVGAVELGVQARERAEYRPLVPLHDLGLKVWPDAPLRDRLDTVVDGDLEGDSGPVLDRLTLRREVDFDDLVLAIPSTAHRRFAAELIDANPRYRAMVEHTHAVPTIAAQCWLARKPASLGFRGSSPLVTGLDGLFRTWADLGEVVAAERWDERPATVAYFCNVAPPELHGTTDRAAGARFVAARMRAWAAGPLARVWSAASDGVGRFDDGALHAPEGEEPWAYQYARANVAEWERYVLTLPGSVKHRLAPDDSGFENLVLAGDWTRNVIDGGSVEGAVSSGAQAANALIER
jgi:uncharacterized protein with NAD-binding domain and iron-sulfur cluster